MRIEDVNKSGVLILNTDGKVDIASFHVGLCDTESIAVLKDIHKAGYNKAIAYLGDIKSLFMTNDSPADKKGRVGFDRENPFSKYHSTVIGVPRGLQGTMIQIAVFVDSNSDLIDIMNDTLDENLLRLSLYVNSKEDRESSTNIKTYAREIDDVSTQVMDGIKLFITKGTKDTRTLGSLINNGAELDEVYRLMDKAGKSINIRNLEEITKKMSKIDSLVKVLTENEDELSKGKVSEIAETLDASNRLVVAVGSVVYLKNSLDIICDEIKAARVAIPKADPASTSRLVYHIGKRGYEDIRPLSLQVGSEGRINELREKSGFSSEKLAEYTSQVNVFLGATKEEHLKPLKKAGFKVYDNIDELYLYTIDLNDSRNADAIKHIGVTSTDIQTEYDKKHWSKFYDANKDKTGSDWTVARMQYNVDRDKALSRRGIGGYSTVDEFYMKNKDIDEWANMDKYWKLNLKEGHKTQYASVVPHLQIEVTKPLVFKEVKKITK